MSPKGNHHEVVKTALLARWYRVRPDDVLLTPETTFRLSEDTYLEPDVAVYPNSLEPKDLRGQNVLLIVEIADSSKRYDMGRKAKLYASFGVRELWVFDAVRLTARVFLEPSAEGYRETRDYSAAEWIVPHFAPEAFALRLADLKRK